MESSGFKTPGVARPGCYVSGQTGVHSRFYENAMRIGRRNQVALVYLGLVVLVLAGCRKNVADNRTCVGDPGSASSGRAADVPLPFTFMPPEAAGFLRINVGAIEKTALGKDIRTALFPPMGDDVRYETLTCLFFRDLSDAPVFVATTDIPYTRAKVLLMNGKEPLEKAHQGKTYYSYASSYFQSKGSETWQRGPESGGLYFIDDRSFLSASISSLHRSLEVLSQPHRYQPSATDLSLYSQAAHVVGSFRVTDEVSQGFKRQLDKDWLSLQPLVTQVKTATIVCNLGNPITVDTELTFASSADAQKAARDVEFARTLVIHKLGELTAELKGEKQNDQTDLATRLIGLISESVRNAVIDKKESSVRVQINLDASAISAYVKLRRR